MEGLLLSEGKSSRSAETKRRCTREKYKAQRLLPQNTDTDNIQTAVSPGACLEMVIYLCCSEPLRQIAPVFTLTAKLDVGGSADDGAAAVDGQTLI